MQSLKPLLTLSFVLTLACSGAQPATRVQDASTDAARAEQGTATVTSTIDGVNIEPNTVVFGTSVDYQFVYFRVDGEHFTVAVTDEPSACTAEEISDAQLLFFDFFHDASAKDARPKMPGAYQAWVPPLNGGAPPTDDRVIVTYVKRDTETGSMGFLAQSGTVTLTAVSDTELSATFDLQFNDGSMKGSFRAVACTPWHLGASIARSTSPSP